MARALLSMPFGITSEFTPAHDGYMSLGVFRSGIVVALPSQLFSGFGKVDRV